MHLGMAPLDVKMKVVKIKGKDEQQRQLANLGFVVNAEVLVVSEIDGNLIVKVKDSRVAVGKDLASRIVVAEA